MIDNTPYFILVPLLIIELYYWLYWLPRNYKETREYKFDKLCSDIEETFTRIHYE